MLDFFSLQGKKALVSGSTRGLGLAIAKGLAEAGAEVAISGRGDGSKGLAELMAYGRRAEFFPFDLSDLDSIPGFAETVEAGFGPIDILVNNAGMISRHPSASFPRDEWDATIRLNASSVFLMCQAFGARMIGRGYGRIINTASLLSFQGGFTVPAYAASKGAVATLTKSLSNEWSGKGVNVNAIAPGYMETEMTDALRADPVRSRQIMERIPAGRWGKPEDLAGVTVFLASRAADYISGEIIVVDGGWMGR